MRISRSSLISILVVGLLAAYWAGSEFYYARSIAPREIGTVEDYFDRFGEPRFVRMVERDGESYYEFNGHPPRAYVIALPSGPPAYIFDSDGRFVAWCADPGDTPSFRHQWPLQSTNLLDVTSIRAMF
jgi:hypothetical protein